LVTAVNCIRQLVWSQESLEFMLACLPCSIDIPWQWAIGSAVWIAWWQVEARINEQRRSQLTVIA
jgi:hypothetical protein